MPEILHWIGVNAPIAQVYEALTTSQGISSWWTRKVKGTPQVGSDMEMHFKNDTLTMRFRIEELKPNALIKWSVLAGPPKWIGSTIQFALAANGDETVVLFSHLGWKEIVEYMRGTPPHRRGAGEQMGLNRQERGKCQSIRSLIIE